MVNEAKLSAVLSEFASTLATDFPIQAILDHLVVRIVDALPVTGAGVTVISPGTQPLYVAASDATARLFERLQTEMQQGPCLLAFETGEPVAIPDLSTDDQFPQFAPAALEGGLAAVFTFPLRHGGGRLGALDLYRDTPGALDPHDMDSAQTLADVAAAYLLNAQARQKAHSASDLFRYIALHDSLTGLPNRLLLQERLEYAGERSRRSHTHAAVLFVDLDRFKKVNDTHGHQVGDDLLRAVAERLSSLVRPGDTLARVSGDEFVFLCEDMPSAHSVELLAQRVDAAFARPFVLPDIELRLTASVGLAFAGPGEEVSHHLVAEADVAMYRKKRRWAGDRVTRLRADATGHESSNMASDLRIACIQDELDLAYQPIVRAADGYVTGVEALLRWTHPERGPIPAISIVSIAEQIGIIRDLGAWVLDRACRDQVGWLRDHPATPLDLAVNVSAHQLLRPDFHLTVADVLDRTGMNPTHLVLEMTETIFIEDSERAMAVLVDLKRLGIRIALDDFGTGYSSLSYLHRLPIDIVKIDQSFIAEVGLHAKGAAIVAAVTDLAHALGLSITAEGIETRSQHDAICAIGCDSAQGFYYARPVPATAIAERLGQRGVRRPRLPLPRSPLRARRSLDV